MSKSKGQPDPLPSWNYGRAKRSIIEFVGRVVKKRGPDFVPSVDRIAVFDNDGTLRAEQPFYVQGLFVFDRVRALAPPHPEWKDKQPFKAVLENDMKTVAGEGLHGLVEPVMATHAGMTTEEFERTVKDWLASARHPKFNQRYTDLVYQPMLELLAYLRANDFRTYIAKGFTLFLLELLQVLQNGFVNIDSGSHDEKMIIYYAPDVETRRYRPGAL